MNAVGVVCCGITGRHRFILGMAEVDVGLTAVSGKHHSQIEALRACLSGCHTKH